jgi:diguanylate cyclase (GGDEF)-like protein
MASPKLQWPAISAVALGIVVAAWLLGGWGTSATTKLVSDAAFLVFGMFAVGCAGLAARSGHGRQRAASIGLMAGLVGWVIGDAIRTYCLVCRHTNTPVTSVADAGYLLLPVGVFVALVLYPIGRSGHSKVRLVLDGASVAGSLFLVLWVLLLRAVFDTQGANHLVLAVSLAQPLADVVIITIAVMVLTQARSGQRATIGLLLAGIVLMAVSNDTRFHLATHHGYARGDRLDIGWIASLLCFALASLMSCRMPHFDLKSVAPPARISMWLPYVPLVLAAAVGTVYLLSPGSSVVLAVTAFLTAAMLARQALVVGENRRLLVAVSDQALRDPLTGLPNRVLFHDRLTCAVRQHREPSRLAVLVLDLNDFKVVNDSLGHPTGDALLVLVAERMVGCVRSGDTVARLGGDEFAILLEPGPEEPEEVAHRLVDAFDQPFVVEGHEIVMRPSVGLAVASAQTAGLSPDLLLKQADVAMYSAKRARPGGLQTFTPDLCLVDANGLDPDREPGSGSSRATLPLGLLGELRRAIDHGDLCLLYQPKFELRTADIVGVEALVRWPHRDRGLLGPEQFLPLVQQSGLLRAITQLVTAMALDDAARWNARGFPVPVAVNLSGPSLCDRDLPAQLTRALTDRGLTSAALTVQITEDVVVGSLGQARPVLHQLREGGVGIAIDDFGGSYSALNLFRELPVDEVKLDRALVTAILDDPRTNAIVRSVVDLARTLGVTTVAEGVENAETANELKEHGCDAAQGHYYSAPLPCAQLLQRFSPPNWTVAAGAPSTGAGLTARLETALNSRIVIEQATGVLAERGGVDMNQALSQLRARACNEDQPLIVTAHTVVQSAGRISTSDVAPPR